MLTGWHVKDPNHMGQKYMALPKRHFTTVVSPDIAWRTGIEGGKYDLRPTPDKHNYFIPNQVRGYAEQGDMNLQFNSVLWGNESTIPEWVKNINSADQFWSVVELHIEKLLTQYRGSAESYSLLNEYLGNPFKDESKYKFWKVKANELGISDVDFVKRVFTKAKSVDPSAVLVYNEYGIEIPGSSTFSVEKEQQTYNLLENAITAGAPIDAVGFQMHLYARDFKNDKFNPTVERFRQQVRRYKELGIQVRLTELDIRLNEGLNDLSLEEKLMLQASIYHRITQVALEEGVESIVVWGVTDRETWLEKPENGLPNASEADPLLFDNEDIPKPAYYALLSSLS
jgi:endo-1,4-beta-xylanase